MGKNLGVIAFLLAVFCAPALAHVTWGYGATTTIEWAWDSRPGPSVPVCVNVVMWAELYVDGCVTLRQKALDDDGYHGLFAGCVDVKLCVNFRGVDVTVEYVPVLDVTQRKDDGDNGDNYRIIISDQHDHDQFPPDNEWSPWGTHPSDTLNVETVHTSATGEKLLTICLQARKVNPQKLPIGSSPEQLIKIGQILTTLRPTILPPTILEPVPTP